jgi:Uma2 family endonuclease
VAIERLRNVADYDDFVEQLPAEDPTPELMNGRYIMAARPSLRHMRYVRKLLKAIEAYVEAHPAEGEILLECEVVLDDFSIVIPDLAYALHPGGQARLEEERVYGAPDFICEVASPSTRAYDAQEKFLAYLRAGVREYWIVDPAALPGKRFTLFERVDDPRSTMPTFRPLVGGPSASHIFPGIIVEASLL